MTNLSDFEWDAIGQQTLDFYVARTPTADRSLATKVIVSLPDSR
jgi:hypothetical protein